MFCVFSGEGVTKLRDYLNAQRMQYDTEGTMYDDAEEEQDGDDQQVVGLMNATGINDDDEEMGEDGDGDDEGVGGGTHD